MGTYPRFSIESDSITIVITAFNIKLEKQKCCDSSHFEINSQLNIIEIRLLDTIIEELNPWLSPCD